MRCNRRKNVFWTLFILFDLPIIIHSQGFFKRIFGGSKDDLEDIPTAKLSNGVKIPLVGLGVGNMIPQIVPAIINHAVRDDKKIRLIDTSNISRNELLVAQGISEGIKENREQTGKQEPSQVHVVTKVWYTHLGYERTKLSVQDSLDNLKSLIDDDTIDLKVHMLIHWPRCYESIQWMNCAEEEEHLPDEVKKAGPPPHLNKNNAWKGSWKALEDIYLESNTPIASIGVSNFHESELKELSALARVQPHIVELSTWSLLYDPRLVDYCHQNGIHLISYNMVSGILSNQDSAPFAYHHLLVVGAQLAFKMRQKGIFEWNDEVSPTQVLLAWLIQHQVSVVPRTTNLRHLVENSAYSLAQLPALDDEQVNLVAMAVEALLSGDDMPEDAYVAVTFAAKTRDVYLYWADHEYGGKVQLAVLKKGQSYEERTHPGHTFRIYEEEAQEDTPFELFIVEGRYGEHHHVEL